MRAISILLAGLLSTAVLQAQPQPQPGPGPGPGPQDQGKLMVFDRNGDGRVDEKEVSEAAREIETLLMTGRAEGALGKLKEDKELRRIVLNGLLASGPGREGRIKPFDPNQDGRFDEVELRQVLAFFNFQNDKPRNRPANGPFEKLIDKNKDGKVDEKELGDSARALAQIAAEGLGMQLRGRNEGPGAGGDKRVLNVMEQSADINKDGKLDKSEQQGLRSVLDGPHPVKSELDKVVDENANGKVEPFEIANFLRLRNQPVLEKAASEGPFTPRTLQDKVFDLNSDNKVTIEELKTSAQILQRGPGKDPLPKSLMVFDLNKDGKIVQDEVFRTLDQGYRPHPVRNEKSKVFDTNKDGFISPEEIGIAAGVTDKGPVQPFDFFMDMAREPGAAQPPVNDKPQNDKPQNDKPKNDNKNTGTDTINTTVTITSNKSSALSTQSLSKYADKKFGVQVETTSSTISKDTLKGITTFVENAFVNTGKVKLVDRNNLDKIMAEAEFQKSGLSEETQEVKLGKLSGAELMVTGTITIFGKKYYLNLKITSVGNGEILGSSVSEAAGEEDFLEMVNSAVVSLF